MLQTVAQYYDNIESFPADTKRWPNVVLMLYHSLRRWPNIKTTLGQRLVSAGLWCLLGTVLSVAFF